VTNDALARLRQTRDSLHVLREFGPDEQRRRAGIAAVARELACRDGYQGVTIRAVADAAATTPVTIYRYFGSKDGLLQHLMAEWAIAVIARLRDEAGSFTGDVPHRIGAAFAQLIHWADEDRNLLQAGMSSVHTNATGTGAASWHPLFTELVRAALADPGWHDDHRQALVLGHVLIACLLDLTAGSRDASQISRTIDTAAQLIFGQE
jgi:AcrR family transcriptional regulator